MKSLVTQARLKELLIYAPKTGRFYWRKQHGTMAGRSEAGTNANGYTRIWIDGQSYAAHRLAWLYVHGEPPSTPIDHRNGVRDDNRLVNLRQCRGFENFWNTRRRKATAYKGVTQRPNGRFEARITWYGRTFQIGTYASAKEAARNYDVHAYVLFGDFARPNGSLAGIKEDDDVKTSRNSRRKRRTRKRALGRRR